MSKTEKIEKVAKKIEFYRSRPLTWAGVREDYISFMSGGMGALVPEEMERFYAGWTIPMFIAVWDAIEYNEPMLYTTTY